MTKFPAEELLVAGRHVRARRRLSMERPPRPARAVARRRGRRHGALTIMAGRRRGTGSESRRRPGPRALSADAADPRALRTPSSRYSRRARCTARRTCTPGRRPSRSASARVLGRRDRVAGTYRGHGHALALGVDPQALLDEMLGRATGVCGGRAGSMNVIDLEHRLIGCFGIVGGSIAAATGAALAAAAHAAASPSRSSATATTNHGYFHECLNFAKVDAPAGRLRLREQPLRRVHAVGGRHGRRRSRPRPRALGIPTETIDGNDVWAVREPAAAAVDARAPGRRPAFIEAMTYRFVGHSRSDPGKYRKPGELDAWRERDPLKLIAPRRSSTASVSTRPSRRDRPSASDGEIETMIETALAAPYPRPARAAEFKLTWPR